MRASYRCDCVERHDLRPGRITLPVLEQDPGDKLLRDIEQDCGERPIGCPWRALRDPFVARVIKAHPAWKVGQRVHGAALNDGCLAFERALNAFQVADLRAEKKKRDAKKAQPERRRRR